jgi:hypothetical protein
VWFTAYLLNYNKQTNNPSILSVLLINDHDKSQVLEQKFVMAAGLAFGDVFIPDNIPPGDYSFILYTNVLTNGKPNDVFTQPITIKATSKPDIIASLKLMDTTKSITARFRKVVLKIVAKDGSPIENVEVIYHIGNYRHLALSGKIKTDKNGQHIFSIPENQIIAGENVLDVIIHYNKETRNIRLILPVSENKINIKFYPEGGNLVYATQSIIGWEVKNMDGAPLRISGVLYKDKHAIDTIYTDDYGMGRFKLIPLMRSDYQVRLIGTGKDTIYQLPKISATGPVINIKNAIVDDTLKIKLVSKHPGRFFLIVHNYRQIYFTIPVEIGAAGKTVLVILKDVPKGLNTITILDSLQRPYAERIFFAHYNQRTPINISTDNPTYGTRRKVKVKLRLNSPNDTLKGMVSVACVQNNRVEIKKANDVESYVYLEHELEQLPLKERYMGQSPDDKAYLENVLLIKGWRRYRWEEMEQVAAKDTVKQNLVLKLNGSVKFNNQPLKKAAEVMVRNDSSIRVIWTDTTGHFEIDDNYAITEVNKRIILLLNSKNPGYKTSLTNNFISQVII